MELLKSIWKISKQKDGFTITEVMIGMTLLTIAIVSATNLLVSLNRTNQTNTEVLQAYYLAQEGIEAVRNIRDTNWLHNLDWLGEDSQQVWGGELAVDGTFDIALSANGWSQAPVDDQASLLQLGESATWKIQVQGQEIVKFESASNVYLSSQGQVGEQSLTGFKRDISIEEYDKCGQEDCSDFVLVTSRVYWGNDDEVVLNSVLSNWKGGVL